MQIEHECILKRYKDINHVNPSYEAALSLRMHVGPLDQILVM